VVPSDQDVGWSEDEGLTFSDTSSFVNTSEPPWLDVVRGGKLIPVIAKTTFTFASGGTADQVVPLKTRIDSRAFLTAVVVVRVHAIQDLGPGANVLVRIYNESVEAIEEQTEFIGTSPIATVTITDSTPFPGLELAASSGALASHLRVVLELPRSSSTPTLTLSVDLIGRTHVAGAVVPRDRREWRLPDILRRDGSDQPGVVTRIVGPHGGLATFVRDREGEDEREFAPPGTRSPTQASLPERARMARASTARSVDAPPPSDAAAVTDAAPSVPKRRSRSRGKD
jgi:hypothetical protein